MKKSLLLSAVLAGLFLGNYACATEVSDWNGLKSTDATLTLINDISDPATTATGNPIIKTSITQTISGGENKYTINGITGGIDGFIQASNGANLTFENLTIENFAKARFLAADKDSNITIKDSTFQNNKYSTNGGAVYFSSTGKLDLTNVNFEGNSSTSNGGGALYFGKGSLDMVGGNFYNNNAKSGGGALQLGGGTKDSPSIISLKNVTFEENNTKGNGGALHIGLNNNTKLNNVTFKNNSSSGFNGGGAIYIDNANEITIEDSHYEGNKVLDGDGGAIFLGSGVDTVIDNTIFSGNYSKYTGGAIMAATETSLKITNSEFNDNHAALCDSGALSINGTLDIYNTKFNGNYVEKYSKGAKGGAIWIISVSKYSNIISSEFNGNYAGNFDVGQAGFGGAIYFEGSKNSTIIDTIFANNKATEGGAIYAQAVDLSIFADKKDVTFSGNIAHNDDFADLANSYNGGGAIYFDGNNTLSLNASADRKMIFDDTIAAYGDNTININNSGLSYINQDGTEVSMGNTGEVQFNNYVGDGQGNIFTVNLYGGTLSIGQNNENNAKVVNADGYINFNNFNIKGDSILNTVNNVIGEFAPTTFTVDNDVNWQYKFDVNLQGGKSDKLVGANNSGNLALKLADLNIMNDSADDEVTVSYSDTNVNGSLVDGNKITTSSATYEVTAKNDDLAGSSLVFKAVAESMTGLAGAIDSKSDVYTITYGSDEVVNKWGTYKVTNDLIINANGYGIITDSNLDGIIVAENNVLTVNNTKYFSGFNNAFVVNDGAELNINDSNLTGNTGDAVISNNGTVNVNALTSDVLIEQGEASTAITSNGGVVNLNGKKTVTIDGKISGSDDAKMNIATDTIIGSVENMVSKQNSGNSVIGKVSGGSYTLNNGILNITDSLAAGTFTIAGGTLDLTKGSYGSLSTVLSGGNINMQNNSTSNLALGNVTLSGTTNLSVDANLSSEIMDTVSASNLEYEGGSINVNNINLVGQTNNASVTMPFADDVLKAYVTTDVKSVMGEIYKYTVGYDKNTGNFTFVGGGNNYKDYNPAVMASPIAAQLGGYLTQLNSYDEAFRNMDMYMLMTKKQRAELKMRNRYAINDTPTYYGSVNENNSGWFRPYATFENVNLKGGPRVSNVAYGSFFGAESEMYDLGHGWDGMWGAYIGYNGSHQAFNGVSMYQNGGTLGAVGMAYKGNFFTGLTVNAGANAGEASTMYGTDNFSMLMAGIASKTGYNIEMADGKFIIQPNFLMSYSFVNTFDYTNAAGVKMHSSPLNAIQIEPGLKFIGNLKNGWQPYAGISMVWNIMDKTQFNANDVSLPDLSIKPFVRYGVGVRKTWGDRMTGFFQCYFTNGGRNGVGLQTGFRWSIGKSPAPQNVKNSTPQLKKTEIKMSCNK